MVVVVLMVMVVTTTMTMTVVVVVVVVTTTTMMTTKQVELQKHHHINNNNNGRNGSCLNLEGKAYSDEGKPCQSPGRMKNSSYYIAPVGDRTHDLPHTVASNMVKCPTPLPTRPRRQSIQAFVIL